MGAEIRVSTSKPHIAIRNRNSLARMHFIISVILLPLFVDIFLPCCSRKYSLKWASKVRFKRISSVQYKVTGCKRFCKVLWKTQNEVLSLFSVNTDQRIIFYKI